MVYSNSLTFISNKYLGRIPQDTTHQDPADRLETDRMRMHMRIELSHDCGSRMMRRECSATRKPKDLNTKWLQEFARHS